MQNCGLTDLGGHSIIDCLKCNKTLNLFDIRNNEKLTENTLNHIRQQLGMEPEEFEVNNVTNSKISAKMEAAQLR